MGTASVLLALSAALAYERMNATSNSLSMVDLTTVRIIRLSSDNELTQSNDICVRSS